MTIKEAIWKCLSKPTVDWAEYVDYNGKPVTAQSVSHFKHILRWDHGVKVPANSLDFKFWLKDHGFTVVAVKNHRGQHCMGVVKMEVSNGN